MRPALTEQTEFVVVELDDLEYVRQAAGDHGVALEEVPSEGFEPVTTVTLMLFGAATAVATVMYLVERRKGGQVIDLRPGAPKPVYRTPDLQFGLVLIHRVDGTISVEVKEPRGLFGPVLDALRDLLGTIAGQGLQAAQENITAAVGDAAEVTVTPH